MYEGKESASAKTTPPTPKFTEDCDNIKYIPQSSKPDFNTFLAGVKGAVLYMKNLKVFGDAATASYEYLQAIGFETVEFRY